MAGGRMKYEGKPLTVSTDAPVEIELPSLVYCGRLTGMLFDTDKTFLLPGAIAGMRQLKEYYDEHPPKEVLIVGHTDARGAAAHNVALSEERARSVRAFLTDDVDAWPPPPGTPSRRRGRRGPPASGSSWESSAR